MAAIKTKSKNEQINLETRILATLAMLDICNTDADNLKPEDLNHLYNTINSLNKKTFEDNNEHAFNIVAEHELDEIKNIDLLRERIRRNRNLNIYKQLGWFGLAGGQLNNCKINGTKVIATLLYEIGIKNADDISAAVCGGSLNEDDALKFKTIIETKQALLKKRLASDFAVYNSQNTINTAIESLRPDIEEYVFDANQTKDYTFMVKKKDEDFRKNLRSMFDAYPKPEFLKMYGTMLMEGRNLAQGGNIGSNYDSFCKLMQKQFGEDAPKIIDKALGITQEKSDTSDIENIRKQTYTNKCEELYFKTLAGVLSEKFEANKHSIFCNNFNYNDFIKTFDYQYILPMVKNGINNIGALAFPDPVNNKPFESVSKEYKMNKECKAETAEKQIISIHHKNPIGSALDFFEQIIGSDRLKNMQPNQALKFKLNECNRLYNYSGNFVYVIGRSMHQSLEPENKLKFGHKRDDMIFAAEISCSAIKTIIPKLSPKIQSGLNKYIKMGDKEQKKKIFAYMPLPEPSEIIAIREKLKENKQVHVDIIQKFSRYYNKS